MLKDKLEIIIPTYNRAEKLKTTLEQLLTSPVKDVNITILDNNSNDNTESVVSSFKRNNLKYIKRNRNVGANANVAFAYELAQKQYLWVLCDDDSFNFDSWDEVEDAMNRNQEMIMVAKYALSDNPKPVNILVQATFVPSMILNTKLLDDTVLRNIYDNIYTMYPQMVPICMAYNEGKKIHMIRGADIVLNGNDYGKSIVVLDYNENYYRGANSERLYFKNKTMSQLIGLLNACSILKDAHIKEQLAGLGIKGAVQLLFKSPEHLTYFADLWINFNKKQKLKVLMAMLKPINLLKLWNKK